ncbi:MAG: type II toxin-antitoxin system MqsA family antitoxin [Thermoguttaceae bacterium]|jgi:putative zinc finger/helix-turn-helix YgiT family protein|nr:type II toxin-antitoxin system MqsA family antitoxin [Thermoguttaceae bacterium]
MAAKNCPLCGQKTFVEMRGQYRVDPPPNIPGGTIVIRDASWQHCESCGEDVLPHELDLAIDRERYHRLGLLTPEEIRRVREKTGLSAVDMSHLLGVGEKTYTRWENGHSLQTKASDTLIRLVDRHAEMFALVDAERQPGRDALIARYFAELEHLKGGNRLAMAAHGADMSTETWEAVRERLRALRKPKGTSP